MNQQLTVSAMVKDTRFEGFLLVRSADQRTSSNGGRYLDMMLSDKTGDVNAKVWDPNAQPPESGSVIKVRASLLEYNGRLQMKVEKLRAALPEDNVDLSLLVSCAPRTAEEMLEEINAVIDAMETPDLQKICREMLALTGDALSYYPAAQRMHHAERSGLLHHTTSMLRTAKGILPNYPFLNADLLNAGIIVHDLSKVAEMQSDEKGNVNDYTASGLLLGHLVHGVMQISEAARRCGVDSEYVLLLEHMVISHHERPEYGSPRAPMFAEAQMLHMIDDMDAKMNEMEGILRRTAPGVFSEKIFSLDRRMYHPRVTEPAEAEPEKKEDPAPEKEVRPARTRASGRNSLSSGEEARRAYEGLL